MRSELFWLLSFCGFAAMSLVCGLLAWPQLSAAWPIPMGWGYGIGVLGRFKDYPTFQTYTLSSDGTFRIEKFGHWAERNMLGMVWVDGSLQISSWSW